MEENRTHISQFETRENEITPPDLRADFVRHGKPSYTTEEAEEGNFEGELTVEGQEQARASARKLAATIDRDGELVVFWSSPKRRAQQTTMIMKNVFDEAGIPSMEDVRTIQSLSDVRVSKEFIDKLQSTSAQNLMQYWAETESPDGAEKPADVKHRVERVITYLERIARTIKPTDGRKLHFICVGHEEIFESLLEEGCAMGLRDQSGPVYGEVMSVGIKTSAATSGAVLDLSFRGKNARLNFDKEKRKFENVSE